MPLASSNIQEENTVVVEEGAVRGNTERSIVIGKG